MVVSREVAANRLRRLEACFGRLSRIAEMTVDEYLADDIAQAAAERSFQIAVQCLLDIGNHIVAEQGLGSPDDAQAILDCLARAGVVSEEIHKRTRGLAGFRNILVHDYLAIDHRKVHELLDRRQDLLDLGRALGEHVDRTGG